MGHLLEILDVDSARYSIEIYLIFRLTVGKFWLHLTPFFSIALHVAALLGKTTLVNALIKCGALVNSVDQFGLMFDLISG